MSIVMEILEGLWDIKLSYKGVPTRALLLFVPWEKRKSYQGTLYRMHKNKLIDRKCGKWIISNSGKKYILNQKKLFVSFDSPFKNTTPKNLLLMFDVPEYQKRERQWLRSHLRKFKYKMIQKSVWVGPSPLPTRFVSYLKEIKLSGCIKTFKLAKPHKNKI